MKHFEIRQEADRSWQRTIGQICARPYLLNRGISHITLDNELSITPQTFRLDYHPFLVSSDAQSKGNGRHGKPLHKSVVRN